MFQECKTPFLTAKINQQVCNDKSQTFERLLLFRGLTPFFFWFETYWSFFSSILIEK